MKTPQRILVVISGKRKTHPALQRALSFTESNDLHIHLFSSIYEPTMELSDVLTTDHRKELKRQYLSERSLYLQDIAETLGRRGINCSVHVTWHKELQEAIEQVVDELQPDLVIKRISAEPDSLNPFAMPIDRHLLRYCHAPLLLVKGSHWTNKPILAAVDPTATDPQHVALNHHVLEFTTMLAKISGSPAHTVNTYETPETIPVSTLPGIDYEAIKLDLQQIHSEKMQKLLTPYNFKAEQVHLIEGRADIAIRCMAKELDAQLMVLGTVGRTGLSATFIGNTAEKILAHLRCEILTVKPESSEGKNPQTESH